MARAFLQFTDAYGELNPYELNHLCEVMLCRLEETLDERWKKRRPLSEKDIQFALTNTIRDIAMQLKRREIREQKAHMFKIKKIAA
jgi:hypothetical protein